MYYDYDSIFAVGIGAILIGLLSGIIIACVMGVITRNINMKKGYNGGFAWGFFLGVIGIIVVACRQDNPARINQYQQPMQYQQPGQYQPGQYQTVKRPCRTCGMLNDSAAGFCTKCGSSLR